MQLFVFLFWNMYAEAYFNLYFIWLQEKFIELFSQDAYDIAVENQKRFVAYKHLGMVSYN